MSAITSNPPAPTTLPGELLDTPVIVEDLVNRFKYWHETIREGIQYQGNLYAQVKTYLTADRLQVFSDSYDYVAAGNKVCITAAKDNYTLWIDLRSSQVTA